MKLLKQFPSFLRQIAYCAEKKGNVNFTKQEISILYKTATEIEDTLDKIFIIKKFAEENITMPYITTGKEFMILFGNLFPEELKEYKLNWTKKYPMPEPIRQQLIQEIEEEYKDHENTKP